jgi:hypothetical protein
MAEIQQPGFPAQQPRWGSRAGGAAWLCHPNAVAALRSRASNPVFTQASTLTGLPQ